MKNKEIRQVITDAGVYYWQVADKLGMHDSTFSRKLRHELSKEEKERVLTAIEELKKGDC